MEDNAQKMNGAEVSLSSFDRVRGVISGMLFIFDIGTGEK
jgi:hypothetical protein